MAVIIHGHSWYLTITYDFSFIFSIENALPICKLLELFTQVQAKLRPNLLNYELVSFHRPIHRYKVVKNN